MINRESTTNGNGGLLNQLTRIFGLNSASVPVRTFDIHSFVLSSKFMKSTGNSDLRRRNGFTLVELLVVIAIVAVLAVAAFMFARTALDKAAASRSLSHLRQSGSVLLADAQDKNGRLQYVVNDGLTDSPLLPYNIVREAVGLDISPGQSVMQLCEIMHWNPSKLKPAVYPRNCFGINFNNLPGDGEIRGVEWVDDKLPMGETVVDVRTLTTATVPRPEAYPFLLDSSTARGDEIFSIRKEEGGYPGMRNSGKTHAYFLDGSARQLDRDGLRKAGFTMACDNSRTPPALISL
jgi:prepilin-type N-terminal cleavage/methylation domain-containing protein